MFVVHLGRISCSRHSTRATPHTHRRPRTQSRPFSSSRCQSWVASHHSVHLLVSACTPVIIHTLPTTVHTHYRYNVPHWVVNPPLAPRIIVIKVGKVCTIILRTENARPKTTMVAVFFVLVNISRIANTPLPTLYITQLNSHLWPRQYTHVCRDTHNM